GSGIAGPFFVAGSAGSAFHVNHQPRRQRPVLFPPYRRPIPSTPAGDSSILRSRSGRTAAFRRSLALQSHAQRKGLGMSSVQIRSLAETHGVAEEGDTLQRVDADMRHVLEVLAAMEPRPLHECTVGEARLQPGPATALSRILKAPPDDSDVGMELRMLPGADGDMRARVYTPLAPAPEGGRPMILYLHGGGWVVGDLEH